MFSFTSFWFCLAWTQIREEIDKFGIKVYQFPECDSDEDEEFKQQDRELKVRNLLSRVWGIRLMGVWVSQKEPQLPCLCWRPVLVLPREQPWLMWWMAWRRC